MRCSVPLPVVLALQVLVVVGAFTAVILVLTEQQRTEFKEALGDRLSLQQSTALDAITGPLLERKVTFDNFLELYTNGDNDDKKFAAPSDEPGATNDFNRLMDFYNVFYVITKRDSLVRLLSIANESSHTYPGYAVGGSSYNPLLHDTDNSKNIIWNAWAMDSTKIVTIADELGHACFGAYPINPAGFQIALPYETFGALGSPLEMVRNSSRFWRPPGLISDPTVASGLAHVISYTVVVTVGRPLTIVSISFSLDHVKAIVYSYSATFASRSAIFANYYRKVKDLREYYLVSGKVDFEDYNMNAFTASGSDYFESAWRGGQTPDSVLNAVFNEAQHMLTNTTGSTTFELTSGGSKFVASIARVVDPISELDWLLVQYTPRADFYKDSEHARLIGIVIGVAGAVVVLVTCVLMWVSIHFPLRSLQASMELAADMRNDEVQHIDPILTEIRDINDAFRQMNAKLLAARPFLPQSLLRAGNDSGFEEDILDFDELEISAVLSNNNGPTSAPEGGGSHSESTNGYRSPTASFALKTKKLSKVIASGNHLSKHMEFRKVSLLAINVIGFHNGTMGHPPNSPAVASLHTALARIVEQSVAEERGIVDYFHGDHFLCGFNTARLCGNSVRNSAEVATKVWDRFQSYSAAGQDSTSTSGDLLSAFPLGLAMGLSVGRAAVGNHGTETMQRLATIGGAYAEALRLQDIMGRRVLMRGGSLNPLVAGRCLTMGRVIQDLETSNVYCQILGGVGAEAFLPAAEATNNKAARYFATTNNLAAKKSADASVSQMLMDDCTTVLVACLVSSAAHGGNKEGADDEWLYQLQNVQSRNPFKETNEVLHKLWNGTVSSRQPEDASVGPAASDIPSQWATYVSGVCLASASNSAEARAKLTF